MDINADIVPYFGAAGYMMYSEYLSEIGEVGGKYVDLNEDFFRVDVDDAVRLFYAKSNNKLFKISLGLGYKGTMNGVSPLGKTEDELYKLYPNLWFDDFEKLFWTDPLQGFFFETDPVTHLVSRVNIYIKEMEFNDVFFRFEW